MCINIDVDIIHLLSPTLMSKIRNNLNFVWSNISYITQHPFPFFIPCFDFFFSSIVADDVEASLFKLGDDGANEGL